MQVGFIGLGTMGMPMAKNILKENGSLYASDLVEEKKEEIRALGATIASNEEIAKTCDVVFISMPTVKADEIVVSGEDGLIAHGKEGLWIVDTSTVGYQLSKAQSEEAAKKGIVYVDLPISGGAGRAADGDLSVMLGATKEESDKAGLTPLLECISREVHYAGVRGGGVALKIINNMLSKAILFADAEAVVMAEHMGIPFDTLYEVIQSSSSQNEIFRIKQEHIKHNEYGQSNKSYSPITMSLKDLKLARELLDELHLPGFNCNNMIQWYNMGMQRGYAEKDSSSLAGLLRELYPIQE
ncbi:MAG: NAD(P)-dependent oxidoreductase [Lachnospiraceae bacterium]|nr:NAD(P)-dependent oxidoreductase [Lachnospiraceae bacterium]